MGDNCSNMPAPGTNYVVFRVTGQGYVVLDPSRMRVSGFYPDTGSAQTRCDTLNAELDRKKRRGPRSCMCCGQSFLSEGVHNRLCDSCRRRDSSTLSIPAGSIGQVRRAARL